VYPRADYIAQIGRGKTKESAETAALSEIAYYFASAISAERFTSQSFTSGTAGDTAFSQTEEKVRVETQLKLSAVRYADPPWFDARTREYVGVAYIEREEGWRVYEKNVAIQTGGFLELVQSAEAEGEPFAAALRFRAAEAFTRRREFTEARDFAAVLHPAKAAVAYRETDDALKTLPQKLYTARQGAAVFIDCPTDYEGLIYQAAVKAFSAEGFTVETNRAAAWTVCAIRVDEGLSKTGGGYMYYPALSAAVSGKGGVILSFSVKAERQGAVTPEVAKRRAYTALAAALNENFAVEADKSFFEK
jgi:hypothetical protein